MTLVENIPDRSKFIALEGIVGTPEFVALNEAQRRFVVRFIDQGFRTGTYDSVEAVQVAYGAGKKLKSPRIRAHQILSNRRIRKVLDIHFHRSQLDNLLSDLQLAAKKSSKLCVLTPAVAKALLVFEKYVARESQ